ncbi:hypothetical protein Q757_07530 [Oenococcus alcoholitolerans]|uniref:Uncharacterized protein n=1 Tax=Oenococcus alcoholitolerans TaxID=931074 RepID=A0ABR4XPL1_9LACO|nr:hypothetical protein Q757_07530 [Oenococcus alcoholitolerans]
MISSFIVNRQLKCFYKVFWAGIGNIIGIAVIGTILLVAYSKTRTKNDSLKSEK